MVGFIGQEFGFLTLVTWLLSGICLVFVGEFSRKKDILFGTIWFCSEGLPLLCKIDFLMLLIIKDGKRWTKFQLKLVYCSLGIKCMCLNKTENNVWTG